MKAILLADESESLLLDIKRLVWYFSGAVVNKSQLQTAEGRRAHFIFDPCDLHKLLVLKKQAFHQHTAEKWQILQSVPLPKILLFASHQQHSAIFIWPAAPFSSRAVCPGWWDTARSGSRPPHRPRVPAWSRSPEGQEQSQSWQRPTHVHVSTPPAGFVYIHNPVTSSVHTSSPIWGTKGDFLGMKSVIHAEGLNSLDTSLLMDGLGFGRWLENGDACK